MKYFFFLHPGEPRKYDPNFKGPIQNRWGGGVMWFCCSYRVSFAFLFINCSDIVSFYSRGCTDIVCCILFILAVLGYIAVGILGKWKYSKQFCMKILNWITLWYLSPFLFVSLAWTQGDPRKVIYPTDSRGQFCGQAGTPLEWVMISKLVVS